MSAETCDVLERSGLVDPLLFLPTDVRGVVSDATRLFPNPPGGLAEYQGIEGADRAGYIFLSARQLESGKVGFWHSVLAGGTVFGVGKNGSS